MYLSFIVESHHLWYRKITCNHLVLGYDLSYTFDLILFLVLAVHAKALFLRGILALFTCWLCIICCLV